MPIPDSIYDGVASTNFKVNAEGPSFYTNQIMASSARAFQQFDQLAVANTSKGVEKIYDNPENEARAASQVLTGNELAATINALGQTVASLQAIAQVISKVAQTTPPVTGS